MKNMIFKTSVDAVTEESLRESEKPQHKTAGLQIDEKHVTCCCLDTRGRTFCCRWWFKLLLWTIFITALTATFVTVVLYRSGHLIAQPCERSNETTTASSIAYGVTIATDLNSNTTYSVENNSESSTQDCHAERRSLLGG